VRATHDFVDTTEGHDGLFLLERGDGRAWASLRRQDAQVFVDLPWSLVLLGRIIPGLPAPGRAVRAWTLHHLGREGADGRGLLRRLLRGVAWWSGSAGIDAVVVPLFEDDPLAAEVSAMALTGWGIPPGVARLYVAGACAEKVLRAMQPLLLNGQDA
jgi:hypothetical protein